MTAVRSEVATADIVGLAARTPADHVVIEMLRAALGETPMAVIPPDLSSEQAMQRVVDRGPALVCIAALSPTRGAELRHYCRRLRSELPHAHILVLRPALADADVTKSAQRMKEAGADAVATSTKEAVEVIANLLAQGSDVVQEAQAAPA
jgi:DNA-binding NarL/FixJ family response regulator